MTLADFLAHATRVTYIALGMITLIDLIRHRDRIRMDIALLFVSLALIVLAQELIVFTGQRPIWVVKTMQLMLMAHPYLLLRLVEHFRPVPAQVRWFALVGMLASAVSVLAFPELVPAINLALVLYFALVEIYAVAALIQGALTTAGVTHWRLRMTAVGSGLLAAIFILAGSNIVFPSLAPYTGLLVQFMAMASALSYYVGFSPPRWLRRAWQLNELHRFLHDSLDKPAAERGEQTLPRLCRTAVRAVGGRAAVTALWEETQGLVIRCTTNPALSGSLSFRTGVTGQAWQTRQPVFSRSSLAFAPESTYLAGLVKARGLMAVPIATVERAWGLLVVFLPYSSLFPADDLDLLKLFAEQSALVLEQMSLLDEQRAILHKQQNLVAQLSERTSQLEESNQELEAFSYSVSHDLRAPLRHIEGFTDLLFKTGVLDASDKGRRYLTLISESATRMGLLIDNLLAFSRLGRAALNVTQVDLAGLVEDARRELQVEMDGRQITWKVSRLPRVYGDRSLLRLVFLNLLSNAIKYTRLRAQAQIEVACLPEQPDGITVYVRDNGVGFDMQYAHKLFGVFQRLHHPDEFEGTGIGLANVRRIVHRHGGRTWAESALNQGATFYFTLPGPYADAAGDMQAPRSSAAAELTFVPAPVMVSDAPSSGLPVHLNNSQKEVR